MLEIGSVLDGKYKILNEIGHGGMSVVYLAINERANKTWAVKEVRKDGGNNSDIVRQNLVAETEMLKKLNHSHLPSIVDVMDQDDSFIIVMDYIEGKSLLDVLKEEGPQPKDTVVEWGKQLCDVLEYLHTRNPAIIYRDMKPANVMLKPDGSVMLIDFGTAREYKQQNVEDTKNLGTIGYAAPEQYGGKGQTDGRTDVYCLGATMYHLLTGYSPADTNLKILPLRELNPEFADQGIEEIIARCCQANPNDRYQSCAELMYALEHEKELGEKERRKRVKKVALFAASVAMTLICAIFIIVFASLKSSTTTQLYNENIEMAKTEGVSGLTATVKDRFKSAITLRPSSVEGYNALLEVASNDNEINETEAAYIKEVIEFKDNGTRRNIDYLQTSDIDGYAKFYFTYGSYLYFYGTSSNKRIEAKPLFDNAIGTEHLSESEEKLATALSSIGGFLQAHKEGTYKSGTSSFGFVKDDSDFNYKDVWDTLVACTEDSFCSSLNSGYAVCLYKELASQVYENASQFKEAGVSQDTMSAQLNKIQASCDSVSNNSLASLIAETKAVIEMAKTAVDNLTSVNGK